MFVVGWLEKSLTKSKEFCFIFNPSLRCLADYVAGPGKEEKIDYQYGDSGGYV